MNFPFSGIRIRSIKNEKVPKLLLQPVVENALEHGLDEKEDGEKILCIACLDKGKEILLSVTDNGPGNGAGKSKDSGNVSGKRIWT